MDLRVLQYFVCVVEEGGFHAAARKLHLSQPSLSQQIRQLEAEVGAPLLLRGNRHSTVTQAGRLLYARACTLLQMARQTREQLREFVDGEAGTLYVGTTTTSIFTKPEVLQLMQALPRVRFEVYTSNNAEDLITRISRGQIELAAIKVTYELQPHADVQIVHVVEEPTMAVWTGDHLPAAQDAGIAGVQALCGPPLLASPSTQRVLETLLAQQGQHGTYRCLINSGDVRYAMAEAGLGVALVPQYTVEKHNAHERAQRGVHSAVVHHPRLASHYAIVHQKGGYLSRTAQRLLAVLCAAR